MSIILVTAQARGDDPAKAKYISDLASAELRQVSVLSQFCSLSLIKFVRHKILEQNHIAIHRISHTQLDHPRSVDMRICWPGTLQPWIQNISHYDWSPTMGLGKQ